MAATAFQSMAKFWTEFNLAEVQKYLDTAATELANRQDESDTSRKKLVELSREFKRSSSEEVRKQVAPLLKSFQAEVDSLTKRSKACEAAFLTVYKKMVDVPDPAPILQQSVAQLQKVSKLQDYEIENKQLRETLEEYNSEFKEVKNQEVTINRLKEKIKEYEEKMEENAQAKVKEKEKELQKVFAEKERQLQETQVEVAKKLGEVEQRAATLQAALDNTQSELFDVKAKFDEDAAARAAEMDILVADLERSNQRMLQAEKENEKLKLELASASNALQNAKEDSQPNLEEAIDAISRSTLEHELAAKEREIAQLVGDVQRQQAVITKMKDSGTSQVAKLEELVAVKNAAIETMEADLQAKHDYDEIKRELSILKTMDFPVDPQDEESLKAKSLEMLLLDKNRRLQSENTKLKVENTEITDRFCDLQKQYTESVRTVREQKDLITQLESDLLSVNTLPSIYRGQGEGEAFSPTETELVANAVQQSLNPLANSKDKAAMESLLPIITSQRERFKTRNMELEVKCRQQQQQVSVLQNEVDNLRSDNVKLYEKIKFLQSYPVQGSSKDDESTINRYSSQYEEKLDPFSQFNKKERQQRYMGLRPHERVTLNMGRFILSNKVARTFAFFYTILVHCLVFLVLYKLAYTESCKRDLAAECAKKFAEHMSQVHGGT